MKKIILSCLAIICTGICLSAQIVVSPGETVGPIKRMNADKAESYDFTLTDQFNMYTEYPVALQPDGTLNLAMEPHSFVFIEF